ncbi:TPA: hypothetical protein HA239_05630 [Candidatus Woesearchaeota archaeon]|nr:hypothetical protein QT06_C0001G1242 [archaeon GW2011_AR15]MBS3104293.1 hypothetical protein [Candidatus Woesearchaeota archaeon]HIH41859.1 hypothetical protein [Candidatus Woesearchaeota archaeon]
MDFDNEKKQALNKLDKSKKGEIDVQILSLIKKVNKNPDYYTTSSCAGRVMILKESERKDGVEWVFSSHEAVKYSEIGRHLADVPEETLWFRMEPPIFHVCCRDINAAETLIKIANNSGFRRSGIIGIKKRIIVEILFPEKMDAPISEKGSMIVEEAYLKRLIYYANSKLKKTRKKLKIFEELFP